MPVHAHTKPTKDHGFKVKDPTCPKEKRKRIEKDEEGDDPSTRQPQRYDPTRTIGRLFRTS